MSELGCRLYLVNMIEDGGSAGDLEFKICRTRIPEQLRALLLPLAVKLDGVHDGPLAAVADRDTGPEVYCSLETWPGYSTVPPGETVHPVNISGRCKC